MKLLQVGLRRLMGTEIGVLSESQCCRRVSEDEEGEEGESEPFVVFTFHFVKGLRDVDCGRSAIERDELWRLFVMVSYF